MRTADRCTQQAQRQRLTGATLQHAGAALTMCGYALIS
jgi:hypothetical protein